jgi:thioesterase domain-containing protein
VAGVALCYGDLAQALGPDQGLVGLQSPALSGGQLATSVEELATQYIEAIRRQQPQGPYDLAGWSFGGLVAFEMARQLSEQGERVAFLGLLDAVQTASRGSDRPVRTDIDRLLQACRQFLGDHVNALEERLAEVATDQQRTVLEAWLVGSAGLEVTASDLDRYLEVQEAYETAHRQYRPGAYPGRVDFFRAEERGAEETESPVAPWLPLSGELVEHVVTGRHETMVFAPHSRSLAAALGAALTATRSTVVDKA